MVAVRAAYQYPAVQAISGMVNLRLHKHQAVLSVNIAFFSCSNLDSNLAPFFVHAILAGESALVGMVP